jgi:hypothetical protein
LRVDPRTSFRSRDDDVSQIALDGVDGIATLAPDDLIHEELGIGDARGKIAVGAQANHRKLRVAKNDGLTSAPLHPVKTFLAT